MFMMMMMMMMMMMIVLGAKTAVNVMGRGHN